jgi:DNA-binding protein YbaB
LEELLAIDNLGELRAQVKKLHEKYVQQEACIKKLEFELEMEQGHVKILRHDNKLLRQMTVDMVTSYILTLNIYKLTTLLL